MKQAAKLYTTNTKLYLYLTYILRTTLISNHLEHTLQIIKLLKCKAAPKYRVHALQLLVQYINHIISEQIDLIIHQQKFAELEASWHGLNYLTQQAAVSTKIKIKVLQLSWFELEKDLDRALEFDQSSLFQKIYSNEFDNPGGEPYGLLIGDYYISHRRRANCIWPDIRSLRYFSKLSAAAFCPLVVGVAPALLGIDSLRELELPVNLAKTFYQSEYAEWRELRDDEDARFIGLILPRVLMRKYYRSDRYRREDFMYTEQRQTCANARVWMNSAYCLANIVLNAFVRGGWFTEMHGIQANGVSGGVVTGIEREVCIEQFQQAGNNYATEVCITDTQEKIFADLGLISLCEAKHTDFNVIYSCPSVQRPKSFTSSGATDNAKLSSQLHYILCVSRFAHYVKVIMRDKVGSFITARDCENYLSRWLLNYTTGNDQLSAELKARYPLRQAKVRVIDSPGKPGVYLCRVWLNPHFQPEQLETALVLQTELKIN